MTERQHSLKRIAKHANKLRTIANGYADLADRAKMADSSDSFVALVAIVGDAVDDQTNVLAAILEERVLND